MSLHILESFVELFNYKEHRKLVEYLRKELAGTTDVNKELRLDIKAAQAKLQQARDTIKEMASRIQEALEVFKDTAFPAFPNDLVETCKQAKRLLDNSKVISDELETMVKANSATMKENVATIRQALDHMEGRIEVLESFAE